MSRVPRRSRPAEISRRRPRCIPGTFPGRATCSRPGSRPIPRSTRPNAWDPPSGGTIGPAAKKWKLAFPRSDGGIMALAIQNTRSLKGNSDMSKYGSLLLSLLVPAAFAPVCTAEDKGNPKPAVEVKAVRDVVYRDFYPGEDPAKGK